MCGDCAERPELEICPQCRVVLAGRLSRNRALEELARKTFPREEEESRRLRAAWGGQRLDASIGFYLDSGTFLKNFWKKNSPGGPLGAYKHFKGNSFSGKFYCENSVKLF